jgi:carbonyl reductase 1
MGSETPAWYSKDTVAVVTGSNKGIGRQIVKDIAKHGVTTVLTSRDTALGEQTVAALKAEGLDTVVFYPGSLEVTSRQSVDKFAAWLKSKFGGLNILINNAGIYPSEVSYKAAKDAIDINYISVKTVTKALLPLIRPGGRIVNMGTSLGMLSYLKNETLAKKLGDVDNLTEEFIDSSATKYLEDVKAGRAQDEGWSAKNPQYTESKIFLHAYTRVLAKQLASGNQKVSVNVIHPGFIDTDMTKSMGPGKSGVEVGADTPVWLALLPEKDYPNGLFFSERKEHDYWTSFYQ